MNENYLPLRREIRQHWVYSDSEYFHLWTDILFNARFSHTPKKDVYKGVMYTLNRGEFLYSRSSYSQRLKISENRVRRCIDLLSKDSMIEKVNSLGKNKPTIYKVVNYNFYNKPPSETVVGEGIQEIVTKSPPSDHQVTTTKEEGSKNEKNKHDDEFDSFWEIYPRKAEKKKAFTSFKNIKKKEIEKVIQGTKGYASYIQKEGTAKRYIKLPTTFLNGESWNDYLKEDKPQGNKNEPNRKPKENLEHAEYVKRLRGEIE